MKLLMFLLWLFTLAIGGYLLQSKHDISIDLSLLTLLMSSSLLSYLFGYLTAKYAKPKTHPNVICEEKNLFI